MVPTKILHNGITIPQIGLGVYKVSEADVYDAVTSALKVGYRHIDTASYYQNEQGVGRAIKDSELNREDIFVTTKVWNDEQGYDNTLKAFNRSLEKLGMDYVDLYLVHWPIRGLFAETYRALEHLYKEGLVKAIGVSNFLEHHLTELFETAEIKPVINQIELHPKLVQKSTVDFCRQHDIVIESWAPLGRANYLNDDRLKKIAQHYEKSTAQILLRWHIEQGFVAIPKSTNPERQKENLSIFDFELTQEEMKMINELGIDEELRIGSHPDDMSK